MQHWPDITGTVKSSITCPPRILRGLARYESRTLRGDWPPTGASAPKEHSAET